MRQILLFGLLLSILLGGTACSPTQADATKTSDKAQASTLSVGGQHIGLFVGMLLTPLTDEGHFGGKHQKEVTVLNYLSLSNKLRRAYIEGLQDTLAQNLQILPVGKDLPPPSRLVRAVGIALDKCFVRANPGQTLFKAWSSKCDQMLTDTLTPSLPTQVWRSKLNQNAPYWLPVLHAAYFDQPLNPEHLFFFKTCLEGATKAPLEEVVTLCQPGSNGDQA